VVSIAEPFNYRIFERKRRSEEGTFGVQLRACHVLSVEQKPKIQEADSVLGAKRKTTRVVTDFCDIFLRAPVQWLFLCLPLWAR